MSDMCHPVVLKRKRNLKGTMSSLRRPIAQDKPPDWSDNKDGGRVHMVGRQSLLAEAELARLVSLGHANSFEGHVYRLN